jgi:hypothetical protein
MFIQRIVFGFIAIAIGIVSLKFNYQLVNSTARLEFIESKLGAGSTYLVYKILSVALVLGGILYITGFGTAVFTWLVSPIASLFPQSP